MKKLLLILGMHRSGTSMLTQILREMGIWMGKEEWMNQANKWNEKGYGELKELTFLTEKILSENLVGTYTMKEQFEISDKLSKEIETFYNKYIDNSYEYIAIKDPRLSLLWKSFIKNANFKNDRTISGITIIRNPFEVAMSLEKRQGMNTNYALCAWYHYNWQCLKFSLEHKNLFIDQSRFFDKSNEQINILNEFIFEDESKRNNIDLDNIVDFSLIHNRKDTYKIAEDNCIETLSFNFYTQLIKLCNNEITASEILSNNKNDYLRIVNESKKYIFISEDINRVRIRQFLFDKEKITNLFKSELFKCKKIVLCGNGSNTERLLNTMEDLAFDIDFILDKKNNKEQVLNNKIIKIYDYDILNHIFYDDYIFIITPMPTVSNEIYREITKYTNNSKNVFELISLLD